MDGTGKNRDKSGRFLPGSPGNKGGRPKIVRAIRELAQAEVPEVFRRVIALTRSEDERVALAACQEVLNRAYGKPEQAHKVEAEGLGMTVVVIREGRAVDPA